VLLPVTSARILPPAGPTRVPAPLSVGLACVLWPALPIWQARIAPGRSAIFRRDGAERTIGGTTALLSRFVWRGAWVAVRQGVLASCEFVRSAVSLRFRPVGADQLRLRAVGVWPVALG
jgi:hypothetical protein